MTKQRLSQILDTFFDSFGYVLLSYLLDSAAVSFRQHFVSVLFSTADIAILLLYLERLKKRFSHKLLYWLIPVLPVLAKMALMYFLGYLNMELTPYP